MPNAPTSSDRPHPPRPRQAPPRRRDRFPQIALCLVAALLASLPVAAAPSWGLGAEGHAVPGLVSEEASRDAAGSFPRPTPGAGAPAVGPPYITARSSNGRYFVDQYGQPILVKGDSPWTLMTRLSPDEARSWLADRSKRGFNAAIVSLIGDEVNGAPMPNGRTYDGIAPFVDGDVLRWNEPYWQRAHDHARMAADRGITLLLYPIDAWTLDNAFRPTSIQQCRDYGAKVAAHFRDLPNIVWMSGGDYLPRNQGSDQGSEDDRCIEAGMRGIRDTGDNRLFSMQLHHPTPLSTSDPYWAARVDWNFVYTYHPTYRAVLDAYARRPVLPALMGEANYEGENNQPMTAPTTDETLRRQVLWALTSGSAGDVFGTRDWKFDESWEQRRETDAVNQVTRLRRLFSSLPWWQLAPDVDESFVTAGRGDRLSRFEPLDVLDNDYVTAARTPDGAAAVVYLPSPTAITIDRSKLAGDIRARWFDPSSGATRAVAVTSQYTSPGRNLAGDEDWLLLFTRPGSG